ncbi:MAG: PadR family transcriptional regulator, partial [Theionarchaea archaeon]|nr:PadR family transcriptional regulator [Theionarchaea archaeon]
MGSSMSRKDRKKGLLRLFILRTLSKEAKSGYDILREIGEKTQGEWSPSKGTIYPILSELEEKKLIEGVEEGARARKAFKATKAGNAHLKETIRRHEDEQKKRMAGRRLLFLETFFDERERKLVTLSQDFVDKARETRQKKKAIM